MPWKSTVLMSYLKKTHHEQEQKRKAVIFLRDHDLELRKISFFLMVPTSTLRGWDKEFDDNMLPIKVPDKRGKGSKVTLDMVRIIIDFAKQLKAEGHRIRLQGFTRKLNEEKSIFLSSKTVGDILTANDLRSPKTRKKRPGFYQKLRQEIPNGLISVDGSEIKIHIDDQTMKLNLEMAVDTSSFAHTAFSISQEETSEEFIKVLKDHCRNWGTPLGLVCDSGSANLSDASLNFLDSHNIIVVPAGPSNPKGNGTIEGAFSHFKETVGAIHIKTSSPEALVKSVLQTVVSVYVKMRNRLPLTRQTQSPSESMTKPVPEEVRGSLKLKLQNRIELKKGSTGDHHKVDILHFLIKHMGVPAEVAAVKRAEKTIQSYNMKAILETEKAFVKAVNRKKERLCLPYFFGILKRIQQDQDDQECIRHCQERYNYGQMKKQMVDQQKENESEKLPTLQNVLDILLSAINAPVKCIKDVALRRAQEWVAKLIKVTKYTGTLRKQFEDSLAEMSQLESDVKEKIWLHVQYLLNQKTSGKSVTHFS